MKFGNPIVIIKRRSLKGERIMKAKVLDFLSEEIDRGLIPGAVLHISQKGRPVLHEAIGHRVVYPEKAVMKLDNVFDLASLTKVVATLPILLKLIENGDLLLEDSVSRFIPQFSNRKKSEIKVKHLLTHTSGLPAHRPYFKEELTTDQVLDRIYQEELTAPIGSKVIYSDLGFIVLYKLVEVLTGKPFEIIVKKEIFEPLKMVDTHFNPSFKRERYAATEFSAKLDDYKHGIVHDDNTEFMGGISGHAGLFSTVSDLGNFCSMVENDGIFNGKRILSSGSLKLSRKNFTPDCNENRGLGWMLKGQESSSCGDFFSPLSFGHTGFTGTSIWIDPEINLRVILLTNRVHFGRKDPIIRLRQKLHNIIYSQIPSLS